MANAHSNAIYIYMERERERERTTRKAWDFIQWKKEKTVNSLPDKKASMRIPVDETALALTA